MRLFHGGNVELGTCDSSDCVVSYFSQSDYFLAESSPPGRNHIWGLKDVRIPFRTTASDEFGL